MQKEIENFICSNLVRLVGGNWQYDRDIASAINLAIPLIVSDMKGRKEGVCQLLICNPGFVASVIYRISHEIYKVTPESFKLAYFARLAKIISGSEIYYSTKIGPGLEVVHGSGLVVGPNHVIGNNFTVYQGVTIGQRRENTPGEFMVIGDGCSFYAGSKAFGSLNVGHGVKLGTNAVLLTNADSDCTYVGVPAKKVPGSQRIPGND